MIGRGKLTKRRMDGQFLRDTFIDSTISATVVERGFDLLKAPIRRVTRAHVPVPYSALLEAEITPDPAKIAAAVRQAVS
jgi:pyruvate/2-oxoglutarate/acetoin dehydrogenase E1 component